MAISKAQKKHLKELGLRLKKIREAKGLTLKELGYKIDKDPQWISRIEMGDTNPTYLTLLLLCDGLEVDLKEFL